jgi:DNA primase
VRVKDRFVAAACPFHKGGQEKHPSFWIDRETGAWGCFTCQAKGGSLRDLLREMDVGTRKIEAELEEAEKEAAKAIKISEARRKKKARASFEGEHILPDALLGVFDFLPTTLVDQGFTEETLKAHDIGYDRRYDRITFPIRDIVGNLVGISGRATGQDMPKYKIYNGRRLIEGEWDNGELGEWYPDYSNEGVRDHWWRSHLVYPRLINDSHGQLILVEGYKASMWLDQCGWHNVMAGMGTKMTKAQERLVRRLGVPTFILTDNNPPGREAAYEWGKRLANSLTPVYVAHYPDYCDEDAQPDDLDGKELEEVLSSSERVGGNYVKFKYGLAKYPKKKRQEGKEWRREDLGVEVVVRHNPDPSPLRNIPRRVRK